MVLLFFSFEYTPVLDGIIGVQNYIQIRYEMQRKLELDENFYRAIFLLKNRFNNVNDFLKYWAYSGPCDEGQPEIENIKNFGK